MDEFLAAVARGLVIRLPFLLVCVAGLALIAVRWSRHPKTSLLALLGVGVLLLSSLGTIVVYQFLPTLLERWQGTYERTESVYTLTSFLFYAVDALGVGLLLAAVLTGRPRNVGAAGNA